MHSVIREYRSTAIGLAVAALFTMPLGSGFVVVVFAIPAYVLWAIFNVTKMYFGGKWLKPQVIRLAIWGTMLASIYGLHMYYIQASRTDAEMAIQAVMQYKKQEGVYPASLDVAGVDAQQLNKRWRMRLWFREQGKPRLVYPSTFVVFSSFHYDFVEGKWYDYSG